MRLKDGTNLEGVSWRMFSAAIKTETVCMRFGVPCVITSANDGKHSPKSKHYPKNNRSGDGEALDFRTKYVELDGRELEFRNAVAQELGQDYDVVIEAVGTDNEHLHVEHDPK